MHGRVLCVAASLLAACAGDVGSGSTTSTASTDPDSVAVAVVANASVERVVDGDTIIAVIEGRRESLRLIGIDTPETVKPDRVNGGTEVPECFGAEASAYTSSALPEGTAIRIERDVEARDDYDRLLGYVYRASDGLFVNLAIVRDGYGSVLTFPPNVTYAQRFVAAARDAEAAGRGLWSSCR